MSDKFTVEIISPDKSILNSDAKEVTIPSYEGQMGILNDHIPLITFLRPGLIIVKNNNDERIFFTEDGTVEFANNNLLILSSTTKHLDSLENELIDTMIKKSQEKFNNSETNDKEKYLLSHKIEILKQINQ